MTEKVDDLIYKLVSSSTSNGNDPAVLIILLVNG